MKNKNLPFLIALLFVASALPSLIGFFSSNSDLIYSGVVFNPIDGYTYLAKMQIGISGDWLFTLPFTPDPGEGRLLYPFYIASGKWLHQMGITESVGFNLLRLVSYGLLILVLAKLASALYPDNERAERTALILMAFGGGLGWVLLPFGRFGADFWVAEAFPFLSGLANAHFPLALCLMVISILITHNSHNSWSMPALFLTGFALSILSPFGFVLLAGILTITWIWERVDGIRTPAGQGLAFVVSGIPYCGYQYWAVHSTPQLAAWTAQNQTPSPAIWDVLLTFSPWIILLIFSWKEIILLRKVPVVRRLIVWLAVGLIFTLIPYDLQRRFMIGLSIPFTALGLLVLPSAAHQITTLNKKSAYRLRGCHTTHANIAYGNDHNGYRFPQSFVLLLPWGDGRY